MATLARVYITAVLGVVVLGMLKLMVTAGEITMTSVFEFAKGIAVTVAVNYMLRKGGRKLDANIIAMYGVSMCSIFAIDSSIKMLKYFFSRNPFQILRDAVAALMNLG